MIAELQRGVSVRGGGGRVSKAGFYPSSPSKPNEIGRVDTCVFEEEETLI